MTTPTTTQELLEIAITNICSTFSYYLSIDASLNTSMAVLSKNSSHKIDGGSGGRPSIKMQSSFHFYRPDYNENCNQFLEMSTWSICKHLSFTSKVGKKITYHPC